MHGAALFVVFDREYLFSTRVVDSVFATAGAKGSSGEMDCVWPIAVDCTSETSPVM